jgi:hypothetical protein
MLVKVDRRAGKHFFRREVGIGSRSQKVSDELRMILDTSSSVAGVKKLRLVGVSRGRVCGDELVETDFKAVCSLRILSEKKVANI